MLSDIPSETPPENLAALAEDHYFAANPPPKDLEKHVTLAREFIEYHSAAGRRLVLVTSGGTTVPLGMFTCVIRRCHDGFHY
jgi:phosphopantothenate---cysteine ligase (ATP)